jgi:hypothetical protein
MGTYARVRILARHVNGPWATSFVPGPHSYLVPALPDRGPDASGRAEASSWPEVVAEVTSQQRATEPVDVVVLQPPRETDLVSAAGKPEGAAGKPEGAAGTPEGVTRVQVGAAARSTGVAGASGGVVPEGGWG